MASLFEGYERRIDQINAVLNSYGISSIEEAEKITKDAGLNVYDQVKKIQPICFENACWAYTVGAAIAIKKGCKRAADAAAAIGEGLQAFCIPGSVADHRKVGLGHGNLGKMLLEEETECFCFLAGHESFAAAEGAIGIAEKANKVRQKPLRVILNGLGKDAAQIMSRINGFTFVETKYDYKAAKLNIVYEKAYSNGLRATVKCYGADDVQEGVAISKFLAECDAKKVVETVQGGGEYAMDTDAEVKLTEEDLQIFTESKAGFISASDKGITVALNTELTEELIAEGIERELVSKVQTLRKEAGFEVTDRIRIYYRADGRAKAALEAGAFGADVLALSVEEGSAEGYTRDVDINGEKVTLTLVKN